MKTLLTAIFITVMKIATLTSSFLLFQEGLSKEDTLLIVLSWIMGAGFIVVLFNKWFAKEWKA